MEKLISPRSIQGRDGWKFYKENCPKEYRTKNINRDNHSKIVSSIFKKASESLIENKSGVFLDGLGYFCVMMYPKRMLLRKKYSKTGEKFFNRETNNYPYSPQWIHSMYPKRFFIWTLDRTFSESSIKEPLCKKLKEGMKYVMEYKLMKFLAQSKSNRTT
jgi:hypothetical protein